MIRRATRPLLYLGIVAAVLGLAKIHARYIGHYVLHTTQPSRLVWTIAYIGILAVASYGAGLPDLPRSRRQALTSSIAAPIAAAVVISLIQLIAGDALLPRFVVFGAAMLLVPWNLVCAALAYGGRAQGERRDRVLLVASDAETTALRDELESAPERPAVLVATMRPTDALPTGHRSKPLCERVLDTGATVVVLERSALAETAIVSQAASLHEAGIRVRPLRLFYGEWLGKLPVSELERSSLLFDIREVHGPRYVRLKRLVDVVLGVLGALVLVIAIPFVVVGDLIANRGPLLYRQPRVGKNGRTFDIIKFRTMRPVGPDVLANEWTSENDPRITPFGRFLRRVHLDELPQVINILRGDLSVVGPRPEQPHYVEELSQKLPFYNLRHLVRPGLTGWAQVNYGYAGDERDAMEKLQYEFWYLEHQGLALDARIVGRTIRSIFGSRGSGR
jgi:lipopolysaccharide/colanic/teichoic acid biosynthesis glycosyltransferase